MELGADPDGLSQLADELRRTASSVDSSRRRLGSGLAAVQWHGPDARAFRAEWSGHAAALEKARAGLRRAADDLKRNATEQRRASDGDGSSPADSVMRSTLESIGPLPSSVRTLELNASGGILAALAGGASATITDLPGPRSLVTVGHDLGAGVTGGFGGVAAVWAGDSSSDLGAHAGGTATATAGVTRSWLVDDDDATRGAILRTLEEPLRSFGLAGLGDLPFVNGIPGVGALLNPAGGHGADITTRLVGVSVSADAVAGARILGGAAGSGARAGGEVAVQVGTRTRGESESLVVAGAGGGAAAVVLALFGSPVGPSPSAVGSIATDVEVMPAAHGLRPVVITSAVTADDHTELTRRVLLVDESRAGRSLDRGVDLLRDGDVEGAARELGDLADAIVDEEVSSTDGIVDSTPVGISADLGMIAKGSASLDGELEVTTYGKPTHGP